MKCKTAYLIVDPRLGKNVQKLTDMLALFAAARWKTEIAIKQYGGHTLALATEAAAAGYDLVIGYGGDGTLNQVVNGIMASGNRKSIAGLIPGGTANVWAHELGIPEDPVQASLLLINSEARRVDLGHVEVDPHPDQQGWRTREKREKSDSTRRQHFLLMAGLGVDAAIMGRASSSLKEKIGEAAVALAAVKELPSHHAFPVEVRSAGADGKEVVRWAGEALQVIVGNTRRYGNVAEVTPNALIDDGALDVCIITAGNPLTTIEQLVSILFHRESGNGKSEFFRAPNFRISAPASVGLQLDGSPVKRKDFMSGAQRAALKRAERPDSELVTYRFDAVPRAIRIAIPCSYSGALFADATGKEKSKEQEADPAEPYADRLRADRLEADGTEAERPETAEPKAAGEAERPSRAPTELVDALRENGRKVTVVGMAPNPARKGSCIVAGVVSQKKTGESNPVAVRIDQNTGLMNDSGEALPAVFPPAIREGAQLIVEGKQSKRGVIRAKRILVKP